MRKEILRTPLSRTGKQADRYSGTYKKVGNAESNSNRNSTTSKELDSIHLSQTEGIRRSFAAHQCTSFPKTCMISVLFESKGGQYNLLGCDSIGFLTVFGYNLAFAERA